MRFDEAPDLTPPGMLARGSEKKVMHSRLRIGDIEVVASAGRSMGHPEFKGVSLPLSVPSERRPVGCFSALGESGQVQMPIGNISFGQAVARIAHDLAGLADIAELLGQLQQADLGADDLLFGSYDGGLPTAEEQAATVRLSLANAVQATCSSGILISDSAGMPRPLCSRHTMRRVSGRLRLSTS